MIPETWLVLGASSPIGRAFALTAASEGHDVILAGRDSDDIARTASDIRIRTGGSVDVRRFDALAYDTHAEFAADCRRRARQLNVFVAIGFMAPQEQIDQDFTAARRTIEANYVGIVSILQALSPILQAQQGGKVVVLGSVAGDRGRLKNYVYGSAKAGLHTYLQGLRARLSRSGVAVTTIKPGFIDTAMTWGLPGTFLVASPTSCAQTCLRVSGLGKDRYYPGFWWLIMTIIRAIPERLFVRLAV